jgi:NTP pyrophosphatase (non-canonical NTP hydrolase)
LTLQSTIYGKENGTVTKLNKVEMSEWICKVHHNAIKHGWWESNRPVGELLALVHSEISEALEAYRRNEGDDRIAEELADVVIRFLDFLGGLRNEAVDLSSTNIIEDQFPVRLASLHLVVSHALQVRHDPDAIRYASLMAINHVFNIGDRFGLDIVSAMKDKHAVNMKREYRHGGKRC